MNGQFRPFTPPPQGCYDRMVPPPNIDPSRMNFTGEFSNFHPYPMFPQYPPPPYPFFCAPFRSASFPPPPLRPDMRGPNPHRQDFRHRNPNHVGGMPNRPPAFPHKTVGVVDTRNFGHIPDVPPPHNQQPNQHFGSVSRYPPPTNRFVQPKRKYVDADHHIQVKKKKVDKRDLPENNAYYCDRCDRGFKTQDKFQEHTDGHQQCRVDGCSYVAAPKLVKLHYDFHHRTGLAKKIWQLDSEQDVDKWITDRKRNYPSLANKERKQKEREERRARGDVLHNKYFGRMGKGGKWQNRSVNNKQVNSPADQSDKPCATAEAEDSSGTKAVESVDTVAKDNDDQVPCNGVTPSEVMSALPEPVQHRNVNKLSTKSSGRQVPSKFKGSTLLEKLLASDIRHERNVILQCIRYTVRHFNLKADG